jgi:hypothetical protein
MNLVEMLRKLLEYDDITKSPDYSTILDELELPDDEDPEILRRTLEEELEALATVNEVSSPPSIEQVRGTDT